MIINIYGPRGCGKTTLVSKLAPNSAKLVSTEGSFALSAVGWHKIVVMEYEGQDLTRLKGDTITIDRPMRSPISIPSPNFVVISETPVDGADLYFSVQKG